MTRIECCHVCGQPKFPQRGADLIGVEREHDWPACVNETCDAYGHPMASATFRTQDELDEEDGRTRT